MDNSSRPVDSTVPGASAPVSGTTASTTAPQTESSSFGTNTATDFPPPPKRQDYSAPAPRVDDPTVRENPSGHHAGSNLINKVKGVAAQGHGLGENLRGNFNAAVDTAFNDKTGQQRDEAVASKGEREVINKEFDHNKTPPKFP